MIKANNKKSFAKRMVGGFLATVMVLSAVLSGIGPGFLGMGPQEVYAKAIGQKNGDQATATYNVAKGVAPGYTNVGNSSVFRGGDKDNFASILPYGNVYIDSNELTFANAEVQIADSRFVSVADSSAKTDATGKAPNIVADAEIGKPANKTPWINGSIAYIGGLDAYLKNTTAYRNWNGNTNNYSYLDASPITDGFINVIEPTSEG